MNTESPPTSYFKFATMKDYIDRTRTIWEKVTDTMIKMEYIDDEPSVRGGNDYAIINIPPDQDERIQKINFNHESAHILFDSLIVNFRGENEKIYKEKIPLQIRNLDLKEEMMSIFNVCTNIIDDERVESLMGEVYMGTGKDFKARSKELGLLLTKEAKDPISALFMARFQRDDLIPNKYKEAVKTLENVKLTEKEGTLLVSKKYIEDYVIPFILSNLPDKENPVPTLQLQNTFEECSYQSRKCDHNDLVSNSIIDEESLEEGLEKLKEGGLAKVEEVKDKIEEQARSRNSLLMPDADKLKFIDRYVEDNDYYVNPIIANGMNKILRNIQAKNKVKFTDSGVDLSIAEVIKRKARGWGDKVFTRRKRTSNLEVTISIDASGSMGTTISTARDMVATMFKGIEGVSGINLEAIIWGGGDLGGVGITVINDIKQCKSIRVHEGYGGTPTPFAVEYSVRTIEKKKGRNKLLVVITDGSPSGSGDGYRDAYELTYDEIKRARNKNIGVFGMFLGGYESNHMDRLFGKGGYMIVEDMEEASGKLLDRFQRIVLQQVKRGK